MGCSLGFAQLDSHKDCKLTLGKFKRCLSWRGRPEGLFGIEDLRGVLSEEDFCAGRAHRG